MSTWQLQQTQFRDVVATARKSGPQIVSDDGVETAVVLSIEEWKRLNPQPAPAKAGTKTALEILQSGPRGTFPLPDRHDVRVRKVEPL